MTDQRFIYKEVFQVDEKGFRARAYVSFYRQCATVLYLGTCLTLTAETWAAYLHQHRKNHHHDGRRIYQVLQFLCC
jgi:hypothetical protein